MWFGKRKFHREQHNLLSRQNDALKTTVNALINVLVEQGVLGKNTRRPAVADFQIKKAIDGKDYELVSLSYRNRDSVYSGVKLDELKTRLELICKELGFEFYTTEATDAEQKIRKIGREGCENISSVWD